MPLSRIFCPRSPSRSFLVLARSTSNVPIGVEGDLLSYQVNNNLKNQKPGNKYIKKTHQ